MDETTVDVIAGFLNDLLPRGTYVNFGIGMPTRCMARLTDVHNFMVHTENGLLGAQELDDESEWDGSTISPSKMPMGLRAGAACFDSLESFTMIRGGHLDLTIMGAYEVSMTGDLANWWRPGARTGGIGGAADLAVGARSVWITMPHASSDGRPKLVERCAASVTAYGVVDRIITELGVFQPDEDGFRVLRLAPDVIIEQVSAMTDARVVADPATTIANENSGV